MRFRSWRSALLDPRKYLDIAVLLTATTTVFYLTKASGGQSVWPLCFAWMILKFSFLALSGTYKKFWRFTSLRDFKQTMIFATAADLLALPVLLKSGIPLDSALLAVFTAWWALAGLRVGRRVHFEKVNQKLVKQNGKRTLVYGANKLAQLFIQRTQQDQSIGLFPVTLLDETRQDRGRKIEGVPVHGDLADLEDQCRRHQIQEIVIAKPLPSNALSYLLNVARPQNINVRLLSGHGLENMDGKKSEIFKEINLEDLLDRKKTVVDTRAIEAMVNGKTILVTGAGGSIGSELCRQLMAMGPKSLVLADHSEFNLYQIHKELCDKFPAASIKPVLLDVKDKGELRLLFSQTPIDMVYHAAAYKHVHLVEMNPLVSIVNNVLGTSNVLEVCEEFSTKHFVLISSDKAVNPTSVMGSTKRLCEILTTASALKTNRPYCSVRFGNVLGSSGSFIPLLADQVKKGGPITITDPRMQRYFMTIPEAVSLVLEASRISAPGDINVLKMGNPIFITDIAKRMITLLGKDEKDIPLVYTGIRPGEKLYEELYLCGDELQTHHKDIVVIPRGDNLLGTENLDTTMKTIMRINELAMMNNPEAIRLLREVVEKHNRIHLAEKVA